MIIKSSKAPSPELAPEEADTPADLPLWPPWVLEYQPLRLLQKSCRYSASQPGSLGVVSPGVASIISSACTASEQVTLGPIVSPEDSALVAEMDSIAPELSVKSLAGSYQEGINRCIMDIAEIYSDRPAGMPDIARKQRRSLSEDPRRRRQTDMPSAKSTPKSIKPLYTVL